MTNKLSPEHAMKLLTRRYTAEPEALIAVLCPLLLPIHTLDKEIFTVGGQAHARASFSVKVTQETSGVLVRGRTGKFVPASYGTGEPGWREIAKGRIVDVDAATGIAQGEVYLGFGGAADDLEAAIADLSDKDYLEVDQYGVAAKALSGLSEYYLVANLKARGFDVVRMPEDMAAHLGTYMNFDFIVERDTVKKRLEVKSCGARTLPSPDLFTAQPRARRAICQAGPNSRAQITIPRAAANSPHKTSSP
jgi:hypothetical protein